MGISESDFWNMSFAELNRALSSRKRIIKQQAQEKASFDYILADLIGRSVGRSFSSSNKYPDITEVYPALFNDSQIQEQRENIQNELNIARFKQFAESHNKRFKEVQKIE
jgi:hypothetical protein